YRLEAAFSSVYSQSFSHSQVDLLTYLLRTHPWTIFASSSALSLKRITFEICVQSPLTASASRCSLSPSLKVILLRMSGFSGNPNQLLGSNSGSCTTSGGGLITETQKRIVVVMITIAFLQFEISCLHFPFHLHHHIQLEQNTSHWVIVLFS